MYKAKAIIASSDQSFQSAEVAKAAHEGGGSTDGGIHHWPIGSASRVVKRGERLDTCRCLDSCLFLYHVTQPVTSHPSKAQTAILSRTKLTMYSASRDTYLEAGLLWFFGQITHFSKFQASTHTLDIVIPLWTSSTTQLHLSWCCLLSACAFQLQHEHRGIRSHTVHAWCF